MATLSCVGDGWRGIQPQRLPFSWSRQVVSTWRELARSMFAERAYQPVMTVEDLTTAIPPRIVKLHGTVPSQTPFVITEEDYRTCRGCFAPFVNTPEPCAKRDR